ncbi:FixH family protein [Streptomyces sp. NBC_00154]|uniref:FixH family protein n=1 Tax=Streptomyces sp. NBC_00154 TaxID=2975670 RepID=UPI002255E1A3|nr:FixH family protein [Streptomyces sp. NBC_00154]MCX5316122.1 FixH family protein [Streptomyces sp. NBC_00154]
MTRRTATNQPAELGTTATPSARPSTRTGAVRLAVVLTAALAAVVLTGCSQKADTSANSGSSGGTCHDTKTDAGLKVTLTASPCPLQGGKTGTATITVKDAGGNAVDGAKVQINPEMPAMKMKGGDQTATAKGDGYEAKLVLGMPGDWKVAVHVTPSSGKTSSTQFVLTAK